MKKNRFAFSLFCLALSLIFFWPLTNNARAQPIADWIANPQVSEAEFRQNLYSNLQRLGISESEACPTLQIPSLRANIPTGIFRLSTTDIDKSFIDEIETDLQSRKLVSTVLTLAADLAFLVVAEGIESAEQEKILAEMDCAYGQGYFYAKPMEEKDATGWLEKYSSDS